MWVASWIGPISTLSLDFNLMLMSARMEDGMKLSLKMGLNMELELPIFMKKHLPRNLYFVSGCNGDILSLSLDTQKLHD